MGARVQNAIKALIIPARLGQDHPLREAVEEFRDVHFRKYEGSRGRERDKFDDQSTYVGIFEGEALAAACRIIHAPPVKILPIQERRDLSDVIPHCAEVSRVSFRHHLVNQTGVRETFYETLCGVLDECGYEVCYASVQPYYLEALQGLFSNTIMVRAGETVFRLKAGKRTAYVPMRIMVKQWAAQYAQKERRLATG